MISALDNKEIISFINLTDSVRKINVKQGKIVLSTYANKEYPELPIKLSAYEGIVVSRFTDDFIKETQLVKKNKLKEKENFENNMAKEEQKVAEIKKINELNAEIRKQKALEEENRIIKEKVAFDIEQISKSKDKQKMVKENHIDKNMIQKKTNSIDSNEDNQNLEHNNGNELNNTESPAMKELHNSDFNNNDHMIDHNADISQKSEIDNKSNLKKLVKTEMNEISSFENDNSIMDEEVGPDDITTLTESELAATTQIDIDEIDDIEEFLKNSK